MTTKPATTTAHAATAATPAPAPAPANAIGAVMFIDLPSAQFMAVVAQITALLKQAQALIVNPTHLTPDERKHSGGKLRDGEAEALLAVINVARSYPTQFASLGDLDNGTDPNTFEVDLVSNRLQNAASLHPVNTLTEALNQTLSDCMLVLNEEARGPAKEAYALAKVLGRSIPAVASGIAPAKTFYAKIAQASAASRAENKAEEEAKTPPTGGATVTPATSNPIKIT